MGTMTTTIRTIHRVTVTAFLEFDPNEGPTYREGYAHAKTMRVRRMAVSADLNHGTMDRNSIRVSGQGFYLKNDGTEGLQGGRVSYVKLVEFPDDLVAQVMGALTAEAAKITVEP